MRTDDRTESASGATSTLLAPTWRRVDGQEAPAGSAVRPDGPDDAPREDAEPAPAGPVAQRSNLAIWLVLAAVGISVLLGVVADARVGVLGISATLAAGGAIRAVARTAPVGLAVRSRSVDVFMFWTLAVVIAVLGVVAPDV